ncbi:MAG TPA: hypothetical protein VFG15_03240 [Amycolatopsis sp.]|nr:hypothetical protein [Amycolatopsis sp.]
MNKPAKSADLVALYKAAEIDPRLSTEEAAEHLAQLVAERQRLTDAVERQTLLSHLSIDQGAMKIDVVPPREVIINQVLAARALLDDAENYSETPVELPPSVEMDIGTAGERYVVIIQRPGKLTPHQARRLAEAERNRISCAVLALADEQDSAAAKLLALPTIGVSDIVVAVRQAESSVRSALAARLRDLADQT